MTNGTIDIEAAKRAQEFQLGWCEQLASCLAFFEIYMSGLLVPSLQSIGCTICQVCRPLLLRRLPRDDERTGGRQAAEVHLVKGALDFVGINHYTTYYTWQNRTNVVGALLHNTLADTGTISLRELSRFFRNKFISAQKKEATTLFQFTHVFAR
jgi:beta-glucosidase